MSFFPYVWKFKTILPNVNYCFYSIKHGIRNIIRWTPIIWNDEDFDWDYLANVMEFKMRNMSNYMAKHGHHVGREKEAKQLLTCAEILKRLREDNSEGVPYNLHVIRMDEWQRELGRLIGKHLRCWWD